MGAWLSRSDPGNMPPQPGVQGQWVELTNNMGLSVWVWYPTPAGVSQLLGPGVHVSGLSKRQFATQIAVAVWSTSKPNDGGHWHETEQNYWIAMDPWKQYLISQATKIS